MLNIIFMLYTHIHIYIPLSETYFCHTFLSLSIHVSHLKKERKKEKKNQQMTVFFSENLLLSKDCITSIKTNKKQKQNITMKIKVIKKNLFLLKEIFSLKRKSDRNIIFILCKKNKKLCLKIKMCSI